MIKVSPSVENKLHVKHGVTIQEVFECFANREGRMVLDIREEHRTDPPTRWFVAETNRGRRLKVLAILEDDGHIIIKSAFDAKPNIIALYNELNF